MANSEQVEIEGVRISHADRVVFPEAGLTKGDVARWYGLAADRLLAFAADRPASLVRCPDGIAGDCFFQKHAGQLPDAIETIAITEKDGKKADYIVISDRKSLIAAAQMGMIEIHAWGARRDRIEQPDRMVLDLDPDASIGFDAVKQAAGDIRDLLREVGLTSFPLLTGGKGVHVIVPLERRQSWDELGDVARGVARSLEAAASDKYVSSAPKEKRRNRIFIDWLRNRRGATSVVPYSVRARKGAPVAMPVSWEELAQIGAANAFRIGNAEARLTADPWPDYSGVRQSLTRAIIDRFADV